MTPARWQSDASPDMFKASSLILQVIRPASRFDMLAIRSTLQNQVPVRGNVAGIRVIDDVIAGKDVARVLDADVASELVDCAIFFLM